MTSTQVFDRSNFTGKFGTLVVPGLSTGPLSSSVLASAAANITFSSIPGTYNILHLIVVGASASAAESDRWEVTVNGTGGTNYDFQQVIANGGSGSATVGVRNGTTAWITPAGATPGDMPGATATAGVAGILDITIPNYAGTTLQKVGLWRSGYSDALTAASDQDAITATVAWRSTAAITSVAIATVTGSNLVTGTAAFLYAS